MYRQFNSLVKGTLIYGMIGGFRSGLEFLLLPIYCRFLSPEQFGTLDLLILFITVASVASILELPNGLFRYYFEQDTPENKNRLAASAVIWCLCSSLTILAAVFVFSAKMSLWLFNDSSSGLLLKLAAIFVVLDSVKTIPLNLLRVQNKPAEYGVISIIQIVAYILGVSIFVIAFGMAVKGILLAKLVSETIALILAFKFSRFVWRLKFDWRMMKSVLAFSIPMIPAGMAIWGINSLNRMFLLKSAGSHQVGLFAMGSKFVVILVLTNIAFQLAWPQFAFGNMKSPHFREMLGKVFSLFFAIIIWQAMFLAIFGKMLIRLVATPDFFEAAEVIFPLALGMVAYGLFYFFATGAFIEKKTLKLLPAISVAMLLNIPTNLILTPTYGPQGTAWVSVITYTTMAIAMFAISKSWKYIGFDGNAIMKLLIINSLALIIGQSLIKMGGLAAHISAVVVFLSVPLALMKSGAISPEIIKSIFDSRIFSRRESNLHESPYHHEKELV